MNTRSAQQTTSPEDLARGGKRSRLVGAAATLIAVAACCLAGQPALGVLSGMIVGGIVLLVS